MPSLVRNSTVLLVLACLALTPAAHAQSLTYVLTGTGSGTLTPTGGAAAAFTNQIFTFTETAPVSGVFSAGGNLLNFSGPVNFGLGSNSGTVAGFGVLVINPGGTTAAAGFSNGGTVSGLAGETFTAGPLTLSAPQSLVDLTLAGSGSFTASFGVVDITSTTSLTFSSTTPEPGSVALLIGLSISGAGFLARRKSAHKPAKNVA